MKCYSCGNCKKSKSKIYKYYCKKFKVKVQDELNGCLDSE